MPKIETVYCAKCGAANQGYKREDGAAMVLQTNGKYENSNIAGCSSCRKYPTGVDEVWTVQDEAVYAPLRKKKLRIEARLRRDKTRKHPYSPRLKKENC
jgi:hypothetical protein